MSTALTAFTTMKTDIEISMDDVVSAFVSKYESNLYAKKKELTALIKEEEEKLENLNKLVIHAANGDDFKEALPYKLKLEISNGSIDWCISKTPKVNFELIIKDPEQGTYRNSLTLTRSKPISAIHTKTHTTIQRDLKEVRDQLTAVLVSIKSVARKEREVRGRIAIRKLEDSGYGDLMQDKELSKLVQLDD